MRHAPQQQDIEYVDVRTGPVRDEPASFYEQWIDQSSAKHVSTKLIAADALRKLYPGHSLVTSEDDRLTSLFTLPDITISPLDSEAGSKQVSSLAFVPAPKRIAGNVAGSLVDHTIFGSYRLTWNSIDFVLYVVKFRDGQWTRTVHFILHEGPEQPARDLLLAAFLYAEQVHDEIWVYDRGDWSKNKSLWVQIKDASWDDVVMKEEAKKVLQKDVYGFFKSERTYAGLSIPWKRGLILYGPPGNGKTISIKVIMKTCVERGFTPLYVKSFSDIQSEEAIMQSVFLKARRLAPCVLILEDLDSLITQFNRSYFLNQLDGLEGNDGLLVIATTNHFDKLDLGLSNRPSRFDRKYLFNDPDHEERVLYAKYWQEKLKDNDEISFPQSLVEEVAGLTQGFSFAYLKEAFVAALVQIANADNDERVAFPVMLKTQIMTLCAGLEKQTPTCAVPYPSVWGSAEKLLGKRDLLGKQPAQEGQITEKSRGREQFLLPTRVSPAEPDNLGDSLPLQMTQSAGDIPPNSSKTPAGGKTLGTGYALRPGKLLPQGRVLHAPPSAYPQVMPGTLPSPNPDRLQEPISAASAWRAGGQRAHQQRGLQSEEPALPDELPPVKMVTLKDHARFPV